VDFVIIGGFALSAHGVIRATKDIDIVPDPDRPDIRRLAHALDGLEADVFLAADLSPAGLGLSPDEEASRSAATGSCAPGLAGSM